MPLKDAEGRTRGFLGRRIRQDKNPHRTLAGPVTGMFHPQAARGSSSVILVEGFLDGLAVYQAGFPQRDGPRRQPGESAHRLTPT